jgi:hypothetical protein
MVNAGVVPEAFGARVGAMVPDPLQHAAVLADLARFRPETEREASILIGESMRAGFVAERQEDMFGSLERSVSLMVERVKVLDQAVRQLATDKRVFALLGKESARIEGAGNQLIEGNAARSRTAAEMQQLVVGLAQRMGPVSDLLTAAAREVKDGGRTTEAAKRFLDAVSQAIEREGLPRLMSDPALRPVETVEPGTPQALAAAERVDLPDDLAGDLFGDAVPLASRDDPMGTRIVSREQALAEAEKTGFAADLVAACKTTGG